MQLCLQYFPYMSKDHSSGVMIATGDEITPEEIIDILAHQVKQTGQSVKPANWPNFSEIDKYVLPVVIE